jgi:hypothetical protein
MTPCPRRSSRPQGRQPRWVSCGHPRRRGQLPGASSGDAPRRADPPRTTAAHPPPRPAAEVYARLPCGPIGSSSAPRSERRIQPGQSRLLLLCCCSSMILAARPSLAEVPLADLFSLSSRSACGWCSRRPRCRRANSAATKGRRTCLGRGSVGQPGSAAGQHTIAVMRCLRWGRLQPVNFKRPTAI